MENPPVVGQAPQGRRAGRMPLVPLMGVLAALATGVAGFAIVLQLQEREKRQVAERELHLVRAENDELRGRVDEIEKTRAAMEDELARAKRELLLSKDELAQAVKAQDTLQRSIDDREQEIARLTHTLEQAQTDSKQATSTLESERDAVKRQIADLERAKRELEAKVMELAGGQPTVELDKVFVTNDAASNLVPVTATSQLASTGQVVVVNREYDFIVMNLGRTHGLNVGQEFQVVRGDDVLGRVKVEKVYDELSAATILPESRKDQIREGDTVKAL